MKTQDPVHPFGQPFIMRGNNSRRAFLPHEAEEFSKNDIGSMFVQIAGRLVSKNKGRAVGERASDGDALLFASRKLAWAMTEAMAERSEEHTSELQSLMRISYAVFCLNKKKNKKMISK